MSSTEIVPRGDALLPIDSGSAKQLMNAYQETTRAMLNADDWIGTPGEAESFVKKSGWLKLARAYRLSTSIVREEIDRDDDGQAIRARAIVRAVAQNGQAADGDGACAINEPRFVNARGRQKVEHDLPATAVTRATNRAISNLVGFGQVSAEEIDADVRAGGASADPPMPPAWACYAVDSELRRCGDDLVAIVEAAGADTNSVTTIGAAIRDECGGIPVCIVRTIAGIRAALGPPPGDANGGVTS